MKLLCVLILLTAAFAQAQENTVTEVETTPDSHKSGAVEEKIKLLNSKTNKETFSTEHKVSFNLKLGYTRLTKEENANENLLNTDFEVRYALSEKFAAHAAMGKWFDVNGDQLSNSSGLLAHHMNIGLAYALSGSFIRKNVKTVNYHQKIFKKGTKFIVKNDRTESHAYSRYNGLRVFINANQMELNNVKDSAPGFGAGAYYEWLKKSGNTFQLGAKYEQFNNDIVDANLGQLYISFGFLP